MAMSLTPVSLSIFSTCDHVFPPSDVLYTPRSGFAPHKCPSAATYTTSGFLGCITIRPMWRVASSPIFFQVFPPSSDLYAPSPQEELCRLFGSPVPTHTTEGSDGAIAMSPIVDTLSLSNIGSHVVPLLVVFHTPPEAVPTYTMFGLLSTTAKSSMRPPIVAGPISRNSRFLNLSVGFGWSPGAASALIDNAPKIVPPARIVRRAFPVCFISIPLGTRPGRILWLGRVAHQMSSKGPTNPLRRLTHRAAVSFHASAIPPFRHRVQLMACPGLQIPTMSRRRAPALRHGDIRRVIQFKDIY